MGIGEGNVFAQNSSASCLSGYLANIKEIPSRCKEYFEDDTKCLLSRYARNPLFFTVRILK